MTAPNPKTDPKAYLTYRQMARDLEQAEAYLRRAATVMSEVFGETIDGETLLDLVDTIETYTLKYNR